MKKQSQSINYESMRTLWNDERGFVISAELILIATILVIGLVVGMSEVQFAVGQELNDVGDAIGTVNQTFFFGGFSANKGSGNSIGRVKSFTAGAAFFDRFDDCDNNQCDLTCNQGTLGTF
ncbi:MAG: hypothetical protein ACKVT0_20485 [Planctomycetaceae bacterium]